MSYVEWLDAQEGEGTALSALKATGLPGPRDEYWRYTAGAPFFNSAAVAAQGAPLACKMLDTLKGYRISIVDGVIGSDLPQMSGAQARLVQAGDVAKWGMLSVAAQTPVARPAALVTACKVETGLHIHVTGTLDKPIVIEHSHNDMSSDIATHIVIEVEKDASATVIEVGPRSARSLSTVECFVADGGALDHVDVGSIGSRRVAHKSVLVRMGEKSRFYSTSLAVNSGLTREEIWVELLGDEAQLSIGGASYGLDGDHDDHTVFVIHDAVACESRQIFKKALSKGSKGVFQGKILVKQGAQKTDGYQMSQSLLLDDDAEFLAKPELEIYADDVACSHGSTSGAIDETALFYLRSRGVPQDAAMQMLTLSFLADALGEIHNEELRDALSAELADWLAARWAGGTFNGDA